MGHGVDGRVNPRIKSGGCRPTGHDCGGVGRGGGHSARGSGFGLRPPRNDKTQRVVPAGEALRPERHAPDSPCRVANLSKGRRGTIGGRLSDSFRNGRASRHRFKCRFVIRGLISGLSSCQICNMGMKTGVPAPQTRLSSLRTKGASLRSALRNAGCPADRVHRR
jgi:hypothetical protein